MYKHKLTNMNLALVSLMAGLFYLWIPAIISSWNLENKIIGYLIGWFICTLITYAALRIMRRIFFQNYAHPCQEIEYDRIYQITELIYKNYSPEFKKQAEERKIKYIYQFFAFEVDLFGEKENNQTWYIFFTNQEIELSPGKTYVCCETDEGFQMEEFICKKHSNWLKKISVN